MAKGINHPNLLPKVDLPSLAIYKNAYFFRLMIYCLFVAEEQVGSCDKKNATKIG